MYEHREANDKKSSKWVLTAFKGFSSEVRRS